MVKDLEIVANDLMVYFNGLKVALGKKDKDEAILLINTIKRELDGIRDYLNSEKGSEQGSKA